MPEMWSSMTSFFPNTVITKPKKGGNLKESDEAQLEDVLFPTEPNLRAEPSNQYTRCRCTLGRTHIAT